MQVNDLIELEIASMSFGPAAVGRHDGVVVFVEGAMPGERAKVRLRKQHKNYWEADLVEILKPSPDRIAPPCAVFERCGGCQWQFMSYDAQIKAKREILIHQLHRAARLPLDEIEAKLRIHPAKSPLGYRSRLQVHGDEKGLGFYGRGSHQIVHTDRCVVAHPVIQKAWTTFVDTKPLAELAKATGQFKIEWTHAQGQVTEAFNRKHGAFGFTQVNDEQNAVMRDIVGRYAAGTSAKNVLFDLYGGDGNLSRDLAKTFSKIACVDTHNDGVDPTEVETPLRPGHHLVRADVDEFLRNQYWRDWGFEGIDCVIADPPRNGLRETARRILDLQASRVILVSCDPSTLARDLTVFAGSYSVDGIDLVDMFPQTYHLETVIALRLR